MVSGKDEVKFSVKYLMLRDYSSKTVRISLDSKVKELIGESMEEFNLDESVEYSLFHGEEGLLDREKCLREYSLGDAELILCPKSSVDFGSVSNGN